VRDVSWHGEQLDLVSSSWDGAVVRWSPGLVGESSQGSDVRSMSQWRRGRRGSGRWARPDNSESEEL